MRIKNLTSGNLVVNVGEESVLYFNNKNRCVGEEIVEITEEEFRLIDPQMFSRGYIGIVSANPDLESENISYYVSGNFSSFCLLELCGFVMARNNVTKLKIVLTRNALELLVNKKLLMNNEDVTFEIGEDDLRGEYIIAKPTDDFPNLKQTGMYRYFK